MSENNISPVVDTTPQQRKRIPMMLAARALNSLRQSGYTLPASLAEVADNSLEARANHVSIHLEDARNHKGKRYISRIITSDDGDGMDAETLHHYPQLGFSTRYMRTDTIGKFGVGAKLGAFQFAKRIDVWSRQAEDKPWMHVALDLGVIMAQEEGEHDPGIEEPQEEPIPEDLTKYFPQATGTVVVWSSIDQLEEGGTGSDVGAIVSEVERELARMFRYFLRDGRVMSVNGKSLLPHDPLFLMDGTWADKVLFDEATKKAKHNGKGADEVPRHFGARRIATNVRVPVGSGYALLNITLYPKEVARHRGAGGDDLAQRLRVPENQGSISFVRLDREINYTNVPRIFPRGVEEADRFIGMEVKFTPELDAYFGVRNVKRGVEPHDELRKRLLEELRRYVAEARTLLDEMWGQATRNEQDDTGTNSPDPIARAAKSANQTLPTGRGKDEVGEAARDRALRDLARDVVGNDKEQQDKYIESIQNLPFVVEAVDFPGHLFIDTLHIDGSIIIRVNTRHRFYREMWEPIKSISERAAGTVSGDEAVRTARRTIEALTLLVIAYGKAESMNTNPRDAYGDLRMYWGQFSDSLMGKVKDVL